MRVLYYTSGITGSGRIVRGMSMATALRRKGINAEFTILSSSPFGSLSDKLGINHVEVPLEDENELSKKNYHKSTLYERIISLNPDILIVDLQWFSLYNFIKDLPCKKIFLSRQVDDRFFTIHLADGTMSFRPEDYTLVLATEPFSSKIAMRQINPMIIRNRDEILSRKDAREKLNLKGSKNTCLFLFNGKPGEFKDIKKRYSYLEDSGYTMLYSTNYEGGLFPAVDYFNAVDLVICSAGYNSFWEAEYFGKEALFVSAERRFENQQKRINDCSDYSFDENGADQLVDIMIGIME